MCPILPVTFESKPRFSHVTADFFLRSAARRLACVPLVPARTSSASHEPEDPDGAGAGGRAGAGGAGHRVRARHLLRGALRQRGPRQLQRGSAPARLLLRLLPALHFHHPSWRSLF